MGWGHNLWWAYFSRNGSQDWVNLIKDFTRSVPVWAQKSRWADSWSTTFFSEQKYLIFGACSVGVIDGVSWFDIKNIDIEMNGVVADALSSHLNTACNEFVTAENWLYLVTDVVVITLFEIISDIHFMSQHQGTIERLGTGHEILWVIIFAGQLVPD